MPPGGIVELETMNVGPGMSSPSRPRSAVSGAGIGMLLATLAAVGVIVGLLTMHVLSPHPSGMSSPASGEVGAAVASHSGQGADAAPVANAIAAVDRAQPDGAASGGCPACLDAQIGLSIACAVVLMIVAVVLVPPRGHWPRLWSPPSPAAFVGFLSQLVPRPPSLSSLCVSRT